MKFVCGLFLMLVCRISFCSSQTTFRKTLGSGKPTDFAVTADDGYVITGYQGSNLMIMKADSAGNVQFVQNYGNFK
jgi:hypothetical protein